MGFVMHEKEDEQGKFLEVRRSRWNRFNVYLGEEAGDWSGVVVADDVVKVYHQSIPAFINFLNGEGIYFEHDYYIVVAKEQ